MAILKIRPIRIEGNVAYIPLAGGLEAIVDAADVALVEGFNWVALPSAQTVYVKTGYCGGGRKAKQPNIYLHRMILSCPEGSEVDHINRDGLDNRRANLRFASRAENLRNRGPHRRNKSGFKGVSFDRRNGKWRASIMAGGKQVHLGMFEAPETAHAAYCDAASLMHGDFARTA